MRNLRLPTALAGIVAAYGLATAPTARAANGWVTVPGGACQLSIPTTNTGVRPKATGFRNESTTTSNFVYCAIPLTGYSQPEQPYAIGLVVYSIDGAAHNVTCTLVVGIAGDVAHREGEPRSSGPELTALVPGLYHARPCFIGSDG